MQKLQHKTYEIYSDKELKKLMILIDIDINFFYK